MTTTKFPKTLVETRWHMYKAIGDLQGDSKNFVSVDAIRKNVPEHLVEHIGKMCSETLRNTDHLKAKKLPSGKRSGARAEYQLTKVGWEFYAKLDQIEAVPMIKRGSYKKATNPKKKIALEDIKPVSAPPNYTDLGNKIADMQALVLQENAEMRDVLFQTCTMIAKRLNMKVVPINEGVNEDGGSNQA